MVKLDVLEQPARKSEENPGADKLLAAWGGAKSGLPFYVFLDAAGKKIRDSNALPNHGNIGFPAAPDELVAFDTLLSKAAPRLSKKAARDTLLARMRRQNVSSARGATAR